MEPPILISLPTENPAGDVIIYFSWIRTLHIPFKDAILSLTELNQSIVSLPLDMDPEHLLSLRDVITSIFHRSGRP